MLSRKWLHVINRKGKSGGGFAMWLLPMTLLIPFLVKSTEIIGRKKSSHCKNLSILALYNSEKHNHLMQYFQQQKNPHLQKMFIYPWNCFCYHHMMNSEARLEYMLSQCWFKHRSTSHIATIFELFLEQKEAERKLSKSVPPPKKKLIFPLPKLLLMNRKSVPLPQNVK